MNIKTTNYLIILIIIVCTLFACTPTHEELIDALYDNDLTEIEKIINSDVDLNDREWCGYDNTIISAIRLGSEESVIMLIDAGVDPKNYFEHEESALLSAIDKGYRDAAKKLIKPLANQIMHFSESSSDNALTEAIKQNDLEIVRLLLEQKPDINALKLYSPLMVSVSNIKNYNPAITKVLIENGADINLKNPEGNTALFFAAINGNIEGLKLLVEHGAKINITNKYGNSPLLETVDTKTDNSQCIRFLVENGANIEKKSTGRKSIVIAKDTNYDMGTLKSSSSKVLSTFNDLMDKTKQRKILKMQAHIRTGATPLHIATYNNNISNIKALLDAGANIDAVNSNGYTSIMIAARYGITKAKKYLKNMGANTKNVKILTEKFND